MATFLEAVGQAARSTYCFALGNFETGAAALGRVSPLSAGIARTAGALRGQLCNDSPQPIQEPDPLVAGGQCSVLYDLVINRTNTLTGEPAPDLVVARTGPIRFVTPLQPPLQCNPGSVNSYYRLVDGNNNPIIATNVCAPFDLNPIVNATRRDGLPDDCGNQGAPVPPPGNIFAPEVNVTYVDEGDNNITVPVNFVFAPVYVDLDGSLTVPVNVDVGGVNFTGNFTIAPEFNLNIKPGGNSPNPGQPDDPDAPGDPGDPGDPVDPQEPDEPLIIGVLVFSDVSEDAPTTDIFFDSGPNIYAPRLANVQFAIAVGGDIGWTSDVPVKSTQAYIPCPAPQGAVDVRVSPQPGVTTRFTPVRGQPLTDFT